MTTLAEKIAVMQAFERGERVETRHKAGGTWVECERPLWDWFRFDYRIAPKPIDLLDVLESLASNVKLNLPEGSELYRVAGHAWSDIIERAKELQGGA